MHFSLYFFLLFKIFISKFSTFPISLSLLSKIFYSKILKQMHRHPIIDFTFVHKNSQPHKNYIENFDYFPEKIRKNPCFFVFSKFQPSKFNVNFCIIRTAWIFTIYVVCTKYWKDFNIWWWIDWMGPLLWTLRRTGRFHEKDNWQG